MSAIESIIKFGILFYALSALVPLLKSKAWWIRVWDFPRLQLLGIGIGLGLYYLIFSNDEMLFKVAVLSILVIGVSFDLYRILPYSPIWRIEAVRSVSENASRSLGLLSVNVLQSNTKSEKLLSLIDKKDPDVILLLEVNQRWIDDLHDLNKKYKYSIVQPQENEYGLALYSKLPLEDGEIKFLIEPDIPSVRTKIRLPSGDRIEVIGIHPRPPRLQDGPTNERDAELVLAGKMAKESAIPLIVMGDLNDVAWSHTTRLFRRISGLLDPRIGRAPFATFPVAPSFLRYPVDYIFHSKSLTLKSLERLENIGSDHFPIYVSLQLEPSRRDEQKGPTMNKGDLQEANATLAQA